MLSHKQCQKALSLIRKDWNPYLPEPVNIPAIAGNPEKMYAQGMRAISRVDRARLEFTDSKGKPFVMIFKEGSTIAYGDGNVYFMKEDVLDEYQDI